MEKLREIEDRLTTIEKTSVWRFYVQTLLVPVLIVFIGTVINWKIERNKSENQRIEIAQKMIPLLFDGKPAQALAAERLLSKVVDPEVANELEKIVTGFYDSQTVTALKNGDIKTAENIVQAAKTIGGKVANQIISNNAKKVAESSTNATAASEKEREGFMMLISGDFEKAQKAFQESNKIYDQYHQAYEIATFLHNNSNAFGDSQKKKLLLRTIILNFSAYAPGDILDKLKMAAK